jgi:hypothetical protein
MDVSMRVRNPRAIELSLTITMDLKAWQELQALLPSMWPATDLYLKIQGLVGLVTQTFDPPPDLPLAQPAASGTVTGVTVGGIPQPI